jgi:hypothetical protein
MARSSGDLCPRIHVGIPRRQSSASSGFAIMIEHSIPVRKQNTLTLLRDTTTYLNSRRNQKHLSNQEESGHMRQVMSRPRIKRGESNRCNYDETISHNGAINQDRNHKGLATSPSNYTLPPSSPISGESGCLLSEIGIPGVSGFDLWCLDTGSVVI